MRISLFSQGTSDMMKGHSPKLSQGRLRLDIRRNFSLKGLLNIGTDCPRRSLSPEVLKKLGVTLSALVYLTRW